MKILMIINLILIIILIALGIHTIIYFKKNENKKVEEIRKSLLTKINIITVLIVVISIINIVNIIINIK